MSYIYGAPILDVSRSHTTTQKSVVLLWTSDQLFAETSTWQHTTLTTEKHPCPGGIRTYDLSSRAAADLRLRPHGHWDWHEMVIVSSNKLQKITHKTSDNGYSRMVAIFVFDLYGYHISAVALVSLAPLQSLPPPHCSWILEINRTENGERNPFEIFS